MLFNVDLVYVNADRSLSTQYHRQVTMEQIRDWDKSGKYLTISIYLGDDMIMLRSQSNSFGIYLGKEL